MLRLITTLLIMAALAGCRHHIGSQAFDVTTYPGATADVQLANCLAAIAKGGGICDATGYGATTQTIAATVSIGVWPAAYGPTRVVFSQATKFQPGAATTQMFLLGPYASVEGLRVDTANQPSYSGVVAMLQGYLTLGIGTAVAPHLTHFIFVGSNTAGGVGVEVTTPPNGTASTYFSTVADGAIGGFYDDILQWTPSSSTGGVNGNSFAHMQLGKAVYAIELRGESGYARAPALQLSANTFTDIAYQATPDLTKAGIWIHGAAAGNQFIGMQLFDAGGPSVLLQSSGTSNAGSGVYSNHVSGWISPIQDDAAAGNTTVGNLFDCNNCLGNEMRRRTITAKAMVTR